MSEIKRRSYRVAIIVFGILGAVALFLICAIIYGTTKSNKKDAILLNNIKQSLDPSKIKNQAEIDRIIEPGIFFIEKCSEGKFILQGIKKDLSYYQIIENFRKDRPSLFAAINTDEDKAIARVSTDEIQGIELNNFETSIFECFASIFGFRLVNRIEKVFDHFKKLMIDLQNEKKIGFILEVDSLTVISETATSKEKPAQFRMDHIVDYNDGTLKLSIVMKLFLYRLFGVKTSDVSPEPASAG